MPNYFITTDSTADFPPSIDAEDFAILPMSYCIDGVVYDGKDTPYLSPREFYTLIEEGKTPTTSRVSAEESYRFFSELLSQGKDVLHISFSSAMSGSYDEYLSAAKRVSAQYPERKIRVLDSKCACAGEGLLCYYALKKRDEGATLDENFEYLSVLRNRIGHAFTVDNLFHLYRGGRLSRGAAIVGQAIKVKPILMVNEDGALVNFANVLGRKAAIRTLVDKMQTDGAANSPNDCVFIAHGDCVRDAELLAEKVMDRFGLQAVITPTGPIIGSHCGKGMLALLYVGENKTNRSV